MPEAFRVLTKELQGLAIDVKLLDNESKENDVSNLSKDNEKEARKISMEVKQLTSETKAISQEEENAD
jgi:hypothetical protein